MGSQCSRRPVLFASIATVQYLFANSVGSLALQADCISMAVDAHSLLGNLFAYCYPEDSRRKRRVELGMSGISHGLLLGFTIQFVLGAISDSQVTHGDASEHERNHMGWVVSFPFYSGFVSFSFHWKRRRDKEEVPPKTSTPAA